jgi:hypothetical protein
MVSIFHVAAPVASAALGNHHIYPMRCESVSRPRLTDTRDDLDAPARRRACIATSTRMGCLLVYWLTGFIPIALITVAAAGPEIKEIVQRG